jgi:hypothetical protein
MNPIVEQYKMRGCDVEVRREDLRVGEPYLPHGKTPSIKLLMQTLAASGRKSGVSCFASRGSDWALNAAIAAHAAKLPFTIYAQQPSKKLPLAPFLEQASDDYAAQLVFVRVNHTAIMIAQAAAQAAERGEFFIPFGLELMLMMDELTERLRGFDKTATIVLCAGSGITLVCLLKAALLDHKQFKRVVAVSSGRSTKAINKTVGRHLNSFELCAATLQLDVIDGHYGADCALESPWTTHPFYERKAFAWLDANITNITNTPISFLNM